MDMINNAMQEDDFDAVLVAELESLREGEKRLQRMFPKLRTHPHLRDRFLLELATINERAERLDAVLNPIEAFHVSAPAYTAPTLSPAA